MATMTGSCIISMLMGQQKWLGAGDMAFGAFPPDELSPPFVPSRASAAPAWAVPPTEPGAPFLLRQSSIRNAGREKQALRQVPAGAGMHQEA